MAQYLGVLQGNRGKTSRLGTKSSGIYATLNGWDVGVTTTIAYDTELKTDVVSIFSTKGSNDRSEDKLLLSYIVTEDSDIKIIENYL